MEREIDKKFFRADDDFTYTYKIRDAYGVEHVCSDTVEHGDFIDIDEDPKYGVYDVDYGTILAHAHEEDPVWVYYSFACGRGFMQTLDGVTSLGDAMRVGLEMKNRETAERIADMRECGIALMLEDANLMSESGRGVAYVDRFVWNW